MQLEKKWQGYTDCRLISVEVDNFSDQANSDSPVLVKTYETLTGSFVEITDPTVEVLENGLKRITKVFRAQSGTSDTGTVGSSSLSSGEILSSSKVEDNTAFAELTQVYVEEGTLFESIEEVGSQKAKVIETIGTAPETPEDYVPARKEESNFKGIKTNRYTFLKPNVTLSTSEDKLGSLEIAIEEIFHPTATSPSKTGFTEVKREESDVDGIKTQRVTFYKDDAIISQSFDAVGFQQSVVISKFKTAPTTTEAQTFGGSGTYFVAKKEEEGKDQVKIFTYTFLEEDVQLSETEDKESALQTISKEFFKPAAGRNTLSNFSLLREESSNVDGVPTTRFTFSKNKAIISQSFDAVGSQRAVVITKFQEEPNVAEAKSFAGGSHDYSVAKREESGEELLQTFTYTFLAKNSILFKSEDKDSALGTIVEEIFEPDNNSDQKDSYKLIDQQESNVEGISTTRFTFVKEKAIISQSLELVGSQQAVVIRKFEEAPTVSEAEEFFGASDADGYVVARKEEEGEEGLKTFVYTFLQKNSVLSVSSDKVGSQLSITNEVFDPKDGFAGVDEDDAALDTGDDGYAEARKDKSDFNGIPTVRITFLKKNTTLSVSEDKLGSQKRIINEIFSPPSESINGIDASGADLGTDDEGYEEVSREKSNFNGIPTFRLTFLQKNTVLFVSEDSVGSQKAVINEVFKPKSAFFGIDISGNNLTQEVDGGYQKAREEKSNFDGIPTFRITFLKKNSTLFVSKDKLGSQNTIVNEVFLPKEADENINGIDIDGTALSDGDDGYAEIRREKSDFDGIPTIRYTFLKKNTTLLVSEDRVGSQRAVINEVFFPPAESEDIAGQDVDGTALPTDETGYQEARREKSNFDGIPTIKYTFLKKNVTLLVTEDRIGSQLAVVNEVFFPPTDEEGIKGQDVAGVELSDGENGYQEARREKSNFDGIPTIKYTFLKKNTILSVSEDKVGSQNAVINEVFFPPAESEDITGKDVSGTNLVTGDDGHIEARREKSDFEGIPTIRYTFLQQGAVLSKTEDKESTLGTIVEEIFKPNDDADEKSEYLLLREEESDVDGIPTKRFTFAKENVIVSSRIDLVGAQEALVITKFGDEEPETEDAESISPSAAGEHQGDFVVARKEKSGELGKETFVYTFLRKSILNVRQEFIEGGDIIDVQAFAFTKSEVESKLEEVTEGHELIDEFKSDLDGIETTTFRFKLKTYTTKETLENGLESVTTYEISTEEPSGLTVGTGGESADAKVLTSFNVIEGSGLFSLEKTETETGILSKERVSAGDGMVRVTTVFFGQKAREDDETIVGPVISETTEDHDGFQTVTVVSLESTNGGTILGKDKSTDKETLVSFTYPGVVFINTVELPSGDNATYSFTAKDFVLEPPVEKLIKATQKVFYTESPEMEEYTGQEGLWCPERWAMGLTSGIGWNYTPFSESQGFRGYRIDDSKVNMYYATALGTNDEGNNWDMVAGRRLWGGTKYLIQVKDGPEDPEDKEYTLDYKVEVEAEFLSEATTTSSESSGEESSGEGGGEGSSSSSTSPSSDGKIIYKHTEIVATIPARAEATTIGSSSGGSDGGYGSIGGG